MCALARNDMQKTDTRVRLQGRHARANLQLAAGLSGSARLHSLKPAMFLYVIARSEATWQSVTPAAGHGEEQRLGRIQKSATDLPKVVPGCQVLLRGERIATPVCALARNDMQKTDTRVRLQGRHALRRPKASGGATLPWGSSPRKGCPFAGSPSPARNDMLKFARCPRSTGVLPEGDLVRGSERNHWNISMSALGNQAGGAKFWQGAQWRRRNFVAIARSLFFVSS